MILKIENAKNGSRVINYVSKNGPDKESKFIYSSEGRKEDFLKYLKDMAKTNDDPAVIHLSASFRHSDGIEEYKMLVAFREAIRMLYGENLLYGIYAHRGKHPHMHAVLPKYKEDGSSINRSNDFFRAKRISRDLERLMNHQPVPNVKSAINRNSKTIHAEIYNYNNELKNIREKLDMVQIRAKSLNEYISLAFDSGIDVQVRYSDKFEPLGISYAVSVKEKLSAFDERSAGATNLKDPNKLVVRGATLGADYQLPTLSRCFDENMDKYNALSQTVEAVIKRSISIHQMHDQLNQLGIGVNYVAEETSHFSKNDTVIELHQLNKDLIERFNRMVYAFMLQATDAQGKGEKKNKLRAFAKVSRELDRRKDFDQGLGV
ncbi:MAG: relaxase/mobilization nuclease domain-containing protein [Cyclobacteriaceae bacterium]|jgi:hypothetical protein